MSSYHEVKSNIRGIEVLLDDLHNQITKSEVWFDEVLENCCQKEEIENSLSEIEDKLKRADNQVSNTLSSVRG